MQLVHIIIPTLGAITLITSFLLILAKRAQKIAMLNQNAPVNNMIKMTDQSEKFWWPMTLAMVLFTYVGLTAMIVSTTNLLKFEDSLFIGIVIFAVLLIIGRKLVS